MHVHVEELSPVEKKVAIEVDWPQVAKKLDEAYRELGKGMNLRGFRKGKAPRSLLESMFGKKVAEDASRELVNESMTYVVSQQPLRMVTEPMLEAMPSAQKDQPLSYTARIELLPQIEVKDYAGIAVSRRQPKATDEQVNESLERKRQAQIELIPVENRASGKTENTDVLTILLSGSLSHLTYKDKEMNVDLTRPEMSPLPGLSDALLGVPLVLLASACGDDGVRASDYAGTWLITTPEPWIAAPSWTSTSLASAARAVRPAREERPGAPRSGSRLRWSIRPPVHATHETGS